MLLRFASTSSIRQKRSFIGFIWRTEDSSVYFHNTEKFNVDFLHPSFPSIATGRNEKKIFDKSSSAYFSIPLSLYLPLFEQKESFQQTRFNQKVLTFRHVVRKLSTRLHPFFPISSHFQRARAKFSDRVKLKFHVSVRHTRGKRICINTTVETVGKISIALKIRNIL